MIYLEKNDSVDSRQRTDWIYHLVGSQGRVSESLLRIAEAMQTFSSVILCTHNPRPDYFRRVFAALQAQTISPEHWEFLLIDNSCKERLEDTWDMSWHPRSRCVREDELGLTAARLRGIKESCGELLVFVDDDNLLAPDFLEQTEAILARYPHLGVFGAGILEPEFEVQPPPEVLPLVHMLAVRSVPSMIWSNNPKQTEYIPWGAGLCVTRRIANNYRQLIANLNVTSVLDRRGQRLFSGGDDVFSWASVGVGLGFGLFPELRVTHLISARRLNRRYFLRLIHDHSFSHGVLDYLLAGIQQQRIDPARYMHLFLHGIKHGQFSMRRRWSALRGKERAARFISEKRLRPVEVTPWRL
jgi:glycosyltransferase involved in cell wall biosynthesis